MDRKRIFIDKKSSTKERIDIIKWAAQNNYDTIVFPLRCKINPKSEYLKLVKKYDLNIEAGGNELSILLPRRYFILNPKLFRMEQGRRKLHRHFCPTNPKTTAVINKQAEKLFSRSMQFVTKPRVYHLYPEQLLQGRQYESTWCSCPACRAFSPAEQNLIAVNSAADVLLKLDPDAVLYYMEFGTTPAAPGVTPRKNMVLRKEGK